MLTSDCPFADIRTVSAVALCIVSGFGGLLAFYIPEYAEAGATYADISALMTYPTMFVKTAE